MGQSKNDHTNKMSGKNQFLNGRKQLSLQAGACARTRVVSSVPFFDKNPNSKQLCTGQQRDVWSVALQGSSFVHKVGSASNKLLLSQIGFNSGTF